MVSGLRKLLCRDKLIETKLVRVEIRTLNLQAVLATTHLEMIYSAQLPLDQRRRDRFNNQIY